MTKPAAKVKRAERPILFSAPMVRAILDGGKTQTRRVVNPQPPSWIDKYGPSADPLHWLPSGVYLKDTAGFLGRGPLEVRQNGSPVKCRYGAVGDRLWVRETWATFGAPARITSYRADRDTPLTGGKWSPSIHMPRWASRITLEITGVRVERLHDISESDAKAEGVPFLLMGKTHRVGFENLWNSIHGCNAFANDNPWVWVISFKRLSTPPPASERGQ